MSDVRTIEFPDRTVILADQRTVDAVQRIVTEVVGWLDDADDELDWLGDYRGRRG